MKWGIKPTNSKKANFREFINFLMKYMNSQIPIALGKNDNDRNYTVSDGNNRIHAILYFLLKPYKIYDDWYIDIFNSIDEEDDNILKPQIKKKLKNIIKQLTYDDIYNNSFDEICISKDSEINKVFDEIQRARSIIKKFEIEFQNLKKKFSTKNYSL